MSGNAFFVVAVLFAAMSSGVVLARSALAERTEELVEASQPTRCCMPMQWSSYMTLMGSINSATPIILFAQTDYTKKQQVMLNYTGSMKTPQSKLLIDYEKEMMYFTLPKFPDYCYKVHFAQPMIRCIPADAEYLGSSYLGPSYDHGSGKLPYDGWRMNFTSPTVNVISTLAMTREDCVPIVEGLGFPAEPSQNQLFLYSGYQPRLTNSSEFILPASCHHQASMMPL